MRTLSTGKLKKISSVMMVFALLASAASSDSFAASGGTFVVNQTQASTPGGLDNTQSITLGTTQTNKSSELASAKLANDSITVAATPKNSGTIGNNITIEISILPIRIGSVGTVMISKSDTTIRANIQHGETVIVTSEDVVNAFQMRTSGMLRWGLINVTISQDINSEIIVTWGNSNEITSETKSLTWGTTDQAQINTLTIGGVLEIGDTFTLNLPQGLISFVTSNTDVNMTTSSINAAIQAIPAYNIQNYTTSALGNIITVTAKTAGDGFSIGTVTAVNASGVPQIITFTPTNPQTGETFRATINGTDYNHTVTVGQTPTDIVNNLSTLINTRTDVTCSEDDSTITCTTVSGSLTSYNARVLESTADTIAPIIAQINPIASGTDTTPDYTFSSTEEGTIVYLGSCTSNTTQANVGPNTITLNLLEVGTYTDCTVKVRDISNNTSNTLLIPAFTVSAISSGGSGGGGGGGGGGSSNASNSSRFTNTTAKIIEEKDELICRGPSETGTWYKTCVTDLSSATFSDFAANAACEGFITQKDNAAAYELTKSAPRQEVVAVAVKMLKKDGKRVEITTPENYKHHFVDIGVEGQASWIQPIVETALINNIISDARNTFQPENSVTRAEAYAMLMASVCMKPSNTGSTWQQNIYNTAEDVGLTTRTWSTFEPENAIMRQDLFVVASRVADWAEKTGGCNPKPSECVAE